MQNVFIFFQWWAVRRVTIVCLFPSVYILQVAFLESRYEFMNSVTMHYILYTIITLTLIISLQMKKKKGIMSNAQMVKRSWLFSLFFWVFFFLWSQKERDVLIIIFTNLLVFDISEGTETYFDYFGLTSLFNLALEAKRDRNRKFFGYYSYPFTSFGKIFLTLINAFRGAAS